MTKPWWIRPVFEFFGLVIALYICVFIYGVTP